MRLRACRVRSDTGHGAGRITSERENRYRGKDHCMNAMTINFLRTPSHFQRVVAICGRREFRIVGSENFVKFHE
jgi:hypothetical protein